MPEKFKRLVMKPAEYKKLVALAKRKGFKYMAPYLYTLIQREIKRSKLSNDELERYANGEELFKDYW